MTIPWLRFVTISHTNVIIFLSLRWLLDEGFKEERQGLQFHMKKHDQKHKVFTYFKEKIETFTETAYFVIGSGVCFTFISEKFYCSCNVYMYYVLLRGMYIFVRCTFYSTIPFYLILFLVGRVS